MTDVDLPPPPGSAHPDYRDDELLREWVDAHPHSHTRRDYQVPVRLAGGGWERRVLERRHIAIDCRRHGPCYVWSVAVDDAGRHIAGKAYPVHHDHPAAAPG